MKRDLDKMDFLWILAVKNNCVERHYRRNYYPYDDFTPTIGLYGRIVNDTLHASGGMGRAMWLLQMNFMLHQMQEEKDTFTLNEVLWLMFKEWAYDITREDLNTMFGDQWQAWSEESGYMEEENGN